MPDSPARRSLLILTDHSTTTQANPEYYYLALQRVSTIFEGCQQEVLQQHLLLILNQTRRRKVIKSHPKRDRQEDKRH
jgi:hypothetical protein